jgi:GAF domain-containing protein
VLHPKPATILNDATPAWFSMLLANDCEPDERLDDITRDASKLFKVPMAMINLVTDDKIIFKACVGETQGKTIDRDGALCSLAATIEAPLMIPDATLDPRFKNYSLVTGPIAVRAYLGTALHAPDGSTIGTLCIFDTKPRTFDAEEIELLTSLAEMADEQLAFILTTPV